MPHLPSAGADLYYVDEGIGVPIVFVHGTGANGGIWGDAFELLAASHRVIAYDRRGFSRSRAPLSGGWEAHFVDAINVVERVAAAPAVLVGWCSGGPMALEVARRRPELVRSLVLVEPAMPLVATLTPSGLSMMMRGKALQLTRGDRAAAAWFYRWATAYRGGGNGFDQMGPDMREAELDNAAASMNEIQGAFRGAGHLGARTLRTIRTPTWCILGLENAHPWYQTTTDFVARQLPHSAIRRIPGAGHAVFRDQPARFVSVVEEAVGAVLPGSDRSSAVEHR